MIKLSMYFFKPLLTSILFSSFIYFEYFGISNKFINTTFALFSFFLLLTLTKKEMFLSGFFISILWFWWIGYSFVYYELTYLIPFIIVGIGLIYGGLFYLTAFFNNIYSRAFGLICLSFVYPFGFNWLQLELPFINSYLGSSKIDFILILISLIIIIQAKKYLKYTAIIPLLCAFNYSNTTISPPNIKISQANTSIPQNIKWDKGYLPYIINTNLKLIDNAIENKDDLIILPESSFPLLLNTNKQLLEILKNKSKQISILVGSLHKGQDVYHNSTYLFQNKDIQIAHKVVLIPFGEAVPLPQKLRNLINDIFYNGAKDYQKAKEPTDFNIKGVVFRNAICYEATTDEIFQNLKSQYMIAISNNAWFIPSTQPTLQKLLLKYYSKKYNIKIFSVTNN